MGVKGFWGRFDGKPTHPASSMTPEELDAAQNQWDRDEHSAKSLVTLLMQKIPDSTLIRIHSKQSVKERWDAIVVKFMEKGAYAKTDLRTMFLESGCPNKGKACEFLNGLHVKREQLAAMGVDIDEKNYISTIIGSLPFHLSQLTTARIATITLEPDQFIVIPGEKYDGQILQCARRYGKASSGDD